MKSPLKKLFFILIAILLAIQVPFIYRRHKIGQLSNKISEGIKLSLDLPKNPDPNFTEFNGVLHVHTSLGEHSTGTFDELIDAANANDLDFVIMTEHYSNKYDTSALTLNGRYGKTLFVNGQEVDTNDGGRFLLIPGSANAPQFHDMDSAAFLEHIHAERKIAINNYPDRNHSANIDFDGMEVYSAHINAKQMNPFTAAFDLLWSYPAYPEKTFATYLRRNDDYLSRYDAISTNKRLLLAAGADAHSNKGYYLIADDEGNKHIGFKIDPYETVLRLVRMHVLLESGTPLSRESVTNALKKGNAFVGFDVLGHTSGFMFSADNGVEKRIMGDEIALANGVELTGSAPQNVRFVIFKNGEKYREVPASHEFSLNTRERGVYRVEAYLDQLGGPFDQTPWIMSNPIYVR
jgi:hypothetical protein